MSEGKRTAEAEPALPSDVLENTADSVNAGDDASSQIATKRGHTPRTPERQQFDDWAGKIAANVVAEMQGRVASKLSDKMRDAYKLGRRQARLHYRNVVTAAQAACPAAELLGGRGLLAVDVNAMRALRVALDALPSDCAGSDEPAEKSSKGGTTMRATGEKPDPLGPTGMGGTCSDDPSESKRAPSAGLGREPKAADAVADVTLSSGDTGPEPGEPLTCDVCGEEDSDERVYGKVEVCRCCLESSRYRIDQLTDILQRFIDGGRLESLIAQCDNAGIRRTAKAPIGGSDGG